MFRRQEKLHSILFEILGTVIKFPDSILLSHIYSLNSMEKKELIKTKIFDFSDGSMVGSMNP